MSALEPTPGTEPTSESATSYEENLIYEKLQQSGEMDRLKDLLRTRLEQYEWKNKVKDSFVEVMQEKEMKELSVPGIVHDLLPVARSHIPDSVKYEMLQQIRQFLEKDQEYSEMYTASQPTTPKK